MISQCYLFRDCFQQIKL